jgi:hypothetical protein
MRLIFIFWKVLPTFAYVPSVITVIERIIISNYSYNKICNKHMIDMLVAFEYN